MAMSVDQLIDILADLRDKHLLYGEDDSVTVWASGVERHISSAQVEVSFKGGAKAAAVSLILEED